MQKVAFAHIGEFDPGSDELLVLELATLGDVIDAREAVRPSNNDDRAEPFAYLDTIVATEYRGIRHRWPIQLVGSEAKVVICAELHQHSADADTQSIARAA